MARNTAETRADVPADIETFKRGIFGGLGRVSISVFKISPGPRRASRMLRGGADNAERGQRGIRARIGAESADKADPRLPF